MAGWLQALLDTLPPLFPLIAVLGLFLHGLTARAPDPPDPQAAFRNSIADAAVREARKVYPGLNAITPANQTLKWKDPSNPTELLVATFITSETVKYYQNPDGTPRTGSAPDGDPRVWVTLAPELQDFCRRLGLPDPSGRLKQYLGLSPDAKYDHIVEMWVKSADLFRPCPDPDVTGGVCQLQSPKTPPAVKNVKDYPSFLLKLYQSQYQWPGGAPWTGLGYTYDLGSDTHIGASEYILVPNSPYTVASVQPPALYCAPGK
jgi:hypothetical protein